MIAVDVDLQGLPGRPRAPVEELAVEVLVGGVEGPSDHVQNVDLLAGVGVDVLPVHGPDVEAVYLVEALQVAKDGGLSGVAGEAGRGSVGVNSGADTGNSSDNGSEASAAGEIVEYWDDCYSVLSLGAGRGFRST